MDEQQVKALLKRMAKLEAENASLKQQIDKKSEDKDLIDLTEPDAAKREGKNVKEEKDQKIKSEPKNRKRPREDKEDTIDLEIDSDDSIKEEKSEEPPRKRSKVESAKGTKKRQVIELSSDNNKLYIDNSGYLKKWASMFVKKVKSTRFYTDPFDEPESTIEIVDKEISKDDFYAHFEGKGRWTHSNKRVVFSTWEAIDELFQHLLAPLHVAWVWEPASKETFWGGMETKAVKRYQTNVKIESLVVEYNTSTRSAELSFECIATEENNENSNIEINKSLNLLDFLASQSSERQKEIFAEANAFKKQRHRK
jgi:hypothetical protein